MRNTNSIVMKAMNAQKEVTNAFDFEKYPHDKTAERAYKIGCARSATALLGALKRFEHAVLSPHILDKMDERFQKFYYSIIEMEMDINSFLSSCKV